MTVNTSDEIMMSLAASIMRNRRALFAMVLRAEQLGIKKGVAVVLVKKRDDVFGEVSYRAVKGVMVRRPRPEEIGAGTNYFGVVSGKIAVMLDTDFNSGTFKKYVRTGEMPYLGGLMRFMKEYVFYTAFSGSSESDDVKVALAGMRYLFSA